MTIGELIKLLPAQVIDDEGYIYHFYIEKHGSIYHTCNKDYYKDYYYVGYECPTKNVPDRIYDRFNAENISIKKALECIYKHLKSRGKLKV